MTRVITADKHHNCEHLLGTFLDESHYDILIEEDCDFYMPAKNLDGTNSEENILFKFRKNLYTAEEQAGAYEGLIRAAGESQNRGLAAGPKSDKLQNRDWVSDYHIDILEAMMETTPRVDGSDAVEEVVERYANGGTVATTRGMVWLRSKILKVSDSYDGWFDRWFEQHRYMNVESRAAAAKECAETFISDTTYANPVHSGIAGFFDRYPRIPYGRATSYTEANGELFSKAFPYLQQLSAKFEELLPERYASQKAAADKLDQRFLVPGTVFTTITVNKTFRTAAHRDAGDLSSGFSNLGCILPTDGKDFSGGYLVLPEFRVAINLRPGDLLLINNHEGIHGNTEIKPANEDCCPECIVRMSVVSYFREKMLDLGSWEYENARREFVDVRRKNMEHPLWKPLWNGVSASMFETQEWYDFLTERLGSDVTDKYHPGHNDTGGSLDDFFS